MDICRIDFGFKSKQKAKKAKSKCPRSKRKNRELKCFSFAMNG